LLRNSIKISFFIDPPLLGPSVDRDIGWGVFSFNSTYAIIKKKGGIRITAVARKEISLSRDDKRREGFPLKGSVTAAGVSGLKITLSQGLLQFYAARRQHANNYTMGISYCGGLGVSNACPEHITKEVGMD
jgi:hypothetical protein